MASAEFQAVSMRAASSLEMPSEQHSASGLSRCVHAPYEIKNTFVEVQDPSDAKPGSRSASAPPTVRFLTSVFAENADEKLDLPTVEPSESSTRSGSKSSSESWSTVAAAERYDEGEIDPMMASGSAPSGEIDVDLQGQDFHGDGRRAGPRSTGRARQRVSQCSLVASCNSGDSFSGVDSLRSASHQRPPPVREVLRPLFANKFAAVSALLKLGRGNPKYYSALINECIKAACPGKAMWCVDEMSRLGIPPNIIHFNKVLHACAKSGDYSLALQWWTRLDTWELVPTNVSYNTMINACAQARRPNDAEAMLQEMITRGVEPCQLSFTTVVVAFASRGDAARAEKWLVHMRSTGLKGDEVMYNAFFNACAKGGALQKARQWVHRMIEDGLIPNVRTYNASIHACAKSGNVLEATELFEEMKAVGLLADLVTFGSLIDTSAKAGKPVQAERWMNAIYAEGLTPNMVCFNSILNACAVVGDLSRAEFWFARLKRSRLPPCGATYNSMIAAFAVGRDEHGMRKLFAEMTEDNIRPDTTTVRTLLSTLRKTEGVHNNARIRQAFGMFERVCMPQCAAFASSKKHKEFLAEMSKALNATLNVQACPSVSPAPSGLYWTASGF